MYLGWEVSKWRLSLFGFIPSEANILGGTTHWSLSSLPTVMLVKLRATFASSHFLAFLLVPAAFEAVAIDSSPVLRLLVSPFTVHSSFIHTSSVTGLPYIIYIWALSRPPCFNSGPPLGGEPSSLGTHVINVTVCICVFFFFFKWSWFCKKPYKLPTMEVFRKLKSNLNQTM